MTTTILLAIIVVVLAACKLAAMYLPTGNGASGVVTAASRDAQYDYVASDAKWGDDEYVCVAPTDKYDMPL